MKVFMALLNFWIAGVYYLVCCEPREHHDLLALFWAIMGCIWVYDLAVGHASLQRTGNHKAFAALLFAMPLVYPLFSLLLGRHLPDDHLAGDALLGGGLHDRADAGLFGESQHRAGDVPLPLGADRTFEGLLLRHSGGLPAGMQHRPGAVPLLPRIHPRQRRRPTKPSPRVLNALLAVMCLIIGCFFAFTLLHQLNLFTDC